MPAIVILCQLIRLLVLSDDKHIFLNLENSFQNMMII